MNGKKARIIRKKRYGAEGSHLHRVYESRDVKPNNKKDEHAVGATIVSAGPQRALYQQDKKAYKERNKPWNR